VQLLLHAVLPAEPEAVNSRCAVTGGATALHAAAERGSVQLVQLLLHIGAARSLQVKDNNGYTPLRKCVHSSIFSSEGAAVMQLLLDAGASATELDDRG
jgi:ankyrin repeat protein